MLEQNKVYTIDTCKEIPCLGGIVGPVTTPVRIKFSDVLWLIKNGYTVYQCNPYDSSEKILVTKSNINNIEFGKNRETVTTQRLKNRAYQEISTPVTVDVLKKDANKKVEPYKAETKKDEKVIAPETSSFEKNDKKSNKVATPDGFSK